MVGQAAPQAKGGADSPSIMHLGGPLDSIGLDTIGLDTIGLDTIGLLFGRIIVQKN